MDRSVKAPGSQGNFEDWKPVIAVGTGFGLIESGAMSMRIGTALYGGPIQDVPVNPVNILVGLATQQLHWTWAATGGAATLLAGTAATVAGSVWAWDAACEKCRELLDERRNRKVQGKAARGKTPRRARRKKESIDERAKFMARDGELTDMSRQAMTAKAASLQVALAEGDEPGVLIGRAVVNGTELYASYEDLHVDIWGPRQGKSTSRVIPAVLDAIGPVVATSNKRDVVDATRELRKQRGGRSWVFDPQGVAAEPVSWYWDPIEWVRGTDDGIGAQERAAELAGHFADGGESTSKDSFFEPEGEDLLAGLFLACAIAKRPITQAFAWVTKFDNTEPVEILDAAGYELLAGALSDQYQAPEKQRSGVFSTAKKMASCLKYSRVRPWVTPPEQDEAPREAFDVDAFVTSRDTLFPLSREVKGSAGPLVTALCAAIAGAGEREGTRNPGGRLPVPLLMVLDEAANIVRWRDLPKQYSHFGSRGMVVMTVLQSWAQGVRCWGEDGMKALWSAANVKVLGSGLDDANFLRDRSSLVGDHYELVNAVSRSPQGDQSTSTSRITERTLTESDLAAIPRGRAVVFSAGRRAVLIETVPWMARPYAAQVSKAIKAAESATAAQVSDPKSARARLRIVPTTEEGKTA
ncbi:type IV secretory system conjugative DNA transfer family protein [Nocardia alba]|uniref:Type IV secretory pathway TraG/TraD family ATPase VirD4 n=1 Tax=Nocardia alba TaxID=225051 RepID=A0A4R1F6B0_9NOCA|nr:type IV secretory system conjugative DNA transfer family protein [Nocardia alba]TCJ88112.1 type IV secretory pathway TraG/TraD family ATPase VirD4 [Nocardia alba]